MTAAPTAPRPTQPPTPLDLEPLRRLSRDVRASAGLLSRAEVRYLVDSYYQVQEFRIASSNQMRSLGRDGEPIAVLSWFEENFETIERNIKSALEAYTDHEPTGMGRWAKAIVGIGPVLSAGLLAHIDAASSRTAGRIWSFAGLTPTSVWLGREKAAALVHELAGRGSEPIEHAAMAQIAQRAGRSMEAIAAALGDVDAISRADLIAYLAKRPWNARLKLVCYKLGESWVKTQNNKNDYYGKLYVKRKAYEIERNERGENAETAARILAEKRIGRATEAYAAYSQGKLPPAQLHARARRWVVKLFLAHWHAEAYKRATGQEPPLPYPIAFLGHVDRIGPPPNLPTE